MRRSKRRTKKIRRKMGGASASAEAFSNDLNQIELVEGIDYCVPSDIDEKYLVHQDTRERTVVGVLKFILACHGANPGGKPNKSGSKRRKTNRLDNGDPTFETSYLNIFRFGECVENAESSVMCSEKVSDYQKIIAKVSTELYDQCIW